MTERLVPRSGGGHFRLLPAAYAKETFSMLHLPKSFWIRPLSIGVALTVPAVVVAATVQFNAGTVLDLATMNALSGRTLDKDRVYAGTVGSIAVAAGAGTTVSGMCAGLEDIMLNCGCIADSGTRQLDLKTLRISNNDSPAALSTCSCAATNEATVSITLIAAPTCIDIPPFR